MIKITNYNYTTVQEGVRLSYTYSELNSSGDITSSNNRKSFIVVDKDVLGKLKEVKEYLENKENGEDK